MTDKMRGRPPSSIARSARDGSGDAPSPPTGARSSPSAWRRSVRGEGGRPECRLDPVPHRVEVDADRRQRVEMECVQQTAAGCFLRAERADDLRLDALRCDAPLAQHRTGLAVGGGKAVQQVLVADEAMPEAARLLGRANNNLPGVAGELF